ncbi:hypothetical protein ACIBTZ_16025 [Micromonospora sp. NPDC049460]|uniref:hypothetical protein n=1 Tax=unclassified Micromonospora TaxID=2617518 RepID=UPI00371196A5
MTTRDGRDERTRRTTLAAATAVIALALVGGLLLRHRATDEAAPGPTAEAAASPDGSSRVPWSAAVVGRDDTTVTVHVGPGDARCRDLVQPRATITARDDAQVVVAVEARIVPAADCTTSGARVPLVVSLAEPLGDRVLRDAAGTLPPPTYFERHVPDLPADKRWSPFSTGCDEGWCQGYNGPGGATLLVTARRTADVARPAPVATVRVGPHRGVVTGAPERSWTVWWEAGDATYSLRLAPAEGASFTLAQFERELARLRWS